MINYDCQLGLSAYLFIRFYLINYIIEIGKNPNNKIQKNNISLVYITTFNYFQHIRHSSTVLLSLPFLYHKNIINLDINLLLL